MSSAVQSGQPLPARLALTQGTALHRINGAWWPRTHDLAEELPALLTALGPHWSGITRVTVDGTMWPAGPEQLQLAGRTVHVTRSDSEGSRQRICLLSYGIGRCDLVVVPPETSLAEARRLMGQACESDAPHTAGASHRTAG